MSTFKNSRAFSLSVTVRRVALAGALAMSFTALAKDASAHDYRVGDLAIDHPWSRATPGGAAVGGGYATIRNEGKTGDRLVSATAEVAAKVEIHEMNMNNGIMTMRALADGLEIPADAEVKLAPGGYHLMFLGLKRPLKKGERVAGTLTFEKAGTVEVEFAVDAIGSTGADHQHEHNHSTEE